MSSQNRVAIIGRPNVGKSTLFNIITDSRKALVKNEPGVTRDIQIESAHWSGYDFDVVDTGGLTDAEDVFSKLIKEQVLGILKTVTCAIVIVDFRAGLVPEDRDVIRLVKRSGIPYIIVVNKVDKDSQMEEAKFEFYELGDEIYSAAFEKRTGITEPLDWMTTKFDETPMEEPKESLTLAIIGKPNAGKSSLCNKLLGENRMMVTDIAGTTTDSIDSEISFNDKRYTIIDTAGMRRRALRNKGVEKLSAIQSEKSIRRADVVLIVADALVGPTEQDARLVELTLEHHKGVIFVLNKSDLGREQIAEFRKTLRSQIHDKFHFFTDIPLAFISAKTGAGIDDLFKKIDHVWEKLNFRIPTSQLNDFFIKAIRSAPAPVAGTKNVKFYYVTQTRQRPPSFIAFANRPDGVSPSYRRFLINKIKENWDLEGIPVRIFAMSNKGPSL